MKNIFILILTFLNLLIVPSYATKPCSQQSHHANSKRSLKEWTELSNWVVILEINKITHKWIPYENCYIENKSNCAQRDGGGFKAEILKIVKQMLRRNIATSKTTPHYVSRKTLEVICKKFS